MPSYPSPSTSTCRSVDIILLHISHVPPDPNTAIHNFSCYVMIALQAPYDRQFVTSRERSFILTDLLSFSLFCPFISPPVQLPFIPPSAVCLFITSPFIISVYCHSPHSPPLRFFFHYVLFSCPFLIPLFLLPSFSSFHCRSNHRPNGCRYQAIYLCQSGYSSL